MKRAVSGTILTLLLIGVLIFSFNFQQVKATATIYIRADGTIDPATAPILTVDNVTYTFTGNINESLMIQRDNIVVDGAGYKVQWSGGGNGIDLSYRNNVTVKNVEVASFESGIYLFSSNNITIRDNKLNSNSLAGIHVHVSSNNNTISGNNITNNYIGIYLRQSSNNTIFENTAMANNWEGIMLRYSSKNTISGNTLTANNNENSILLAHSSNNAISRNNITANNNENGIKLFNSSNNIVSENNITNNNYGIRLRDSGNNTVSGNTLMANNYDGILLFSSLNNTITDNTLATHFDAIYLNSSSGNSISGNDITNGETGLYIGIYIIYSTSNSIFENNITNNYDGIYLEYSSNNTLTSNNISQEEVMHAGNGIKLFHSSNNALSDNNVSSNKDYGIYIAHSGNNTLTSNTALNNRGGIYLSNCSDNRIFHNSFINNTELQASVFQSSNNIWDNGYPSGGNYWDDYTGMDLHSGPYQNLTGSDGIGDTPYIIDMSNTDHYPLMGSVGPSTPTGENVTVFPSPDVGVTYRNVLNAGLTTANRIDIGPDPPTDRHWLGKFYDIQTTANISGKIAFRIIYIDENLTTEEESSLQLAHWMLQGDITGPTGVPDGVVDIRDIALIALHFGQNVPTAPPRCDITGPTPNVPDGKIDIRDIALAAINFGNNQPEWINITTYLDTDSNVIIGETSRLSIFGVHFR